MAGELPGQQPFDAKLPREARDAAWYEELFRLRWSRLQPFAQVQYGGAFAESYGAERFGIGVRKLTDAVLYEHTIPTDESTYGQRTDRFDIFIGAFRASGAMMSHARIVEQLGLEPGYTETDNNGLIFEGTDNRRYLILRDFQLSERESRSRRHNEPHFEGKIRQALERYNVAAIFTAKPTRASAFGAGANADDIDPSLNGMVIVDPDISEKYQLIAWDGFTLNLAQKHGWTNTEYLGFRVRHELPKRK